MLFFKKRKLSKREFKKKRALGGIALPSSAPEAEILLLN